MRNAPVEQNVGGRRFAIAFFLSIYSMASSLVLPAFRMWTELWVPVLGVAFALLLFRRAVHKVVLIALCLVTSVVSYFLGPPHPNGGLSEGAFVFFVPLVIAITGATLIISVRERDA